MTTSRRREPLAPTRARAGHRPTKADAGRTREIAEAALDLFAERGFSSVTIKDIASRLGINTALIYYYFKNKEDLFRACIEMAICDAIVHYDNIRAAHDEPVDLINGWFESNLTLSGMISKLVKVILDYSNTRSRIYSVDRLIKRFYDEETRILAAAITQGVARGVFRPVAAEQLARFISSHLDGVMVSAMVRPGFDIRRAVADLREIVLTHLEYAGEKRPSRRRAP